MLQDTGQNEIDQNVQSDISSGHKLKLHSASDGIYAFIRAEINAESFLEQTLFRKYKDQESQAISKKDKGMITGSVLKPALRQIYLLSTREHDDTQLAKMVKWSEPFEMTEPEQRETEEDVIFSDRHAAWNEKKLKHEEKRQGILYFVKVLYADKDGKKFSRAFLRNYLSNITMNAISVTSADNLLMLLVKMKLAKAVVSPRGNGSQAIIFSDELIEIIKTYYVMKGVGA